MMSDPVTNVEIEDVLSSIRRLVSAEERPARSERGEKSHAPEKLVLTPSLRVDHQEATPEDTTAVEDEVSDQTHADVAHSDTGDIAPEDIYDQQIDEAEIAGTDPAPEDPIAETALQDTTPLGGSGSHLATEMNTASENDTGRAAIFQRAASTNDDEWEPDESSEGVEAPLTEALAWQDATIEAEQSVSQDHGADALEGLEPFTPDPDAPDEAMQDPYVTEEDPAPMPEADNAFWAEDDMFAEDEAILDEEALRDLVAEIVRQELQGALGERITRNVRKLVRREIQRALAAQELE